MCYFMFPTQWNPGDDLAELRPVLLSSPSDAGGPKSLDQVPSSVFVSCRTTLIIFTRFGL